MTAPSTALRLQLLRIDDRPLLFDLDGNSRSAGQVVINADRLAGAIAEVSHPVPKVGFWYRNSFAAVEACLAIEWRGGTRMPVDPAASVTEARNVFEAANVDIVLCDSEHSAAFGKSSFTHDDLRPLAGAIRHPVDDFRSDHTFMVYPRTVTNGKLFGIPLSYRNWHAIVDTNVSLYRSGRYGDWDEATEVFLSAQQIMHGTGFLGTFPFLSMGLPQVIAGDFDLKKVLAAIERHRVTATMFVPAMLRNFLGAVEERPAAAGSLRHLLYGGGPVPEGEMRKALDRIGPVLVQVYGRVEGGWPISLLGTGDHKAMIASNPNLAQSCGRPISEVDVRLRPLPGEPGDVGELLVKSDMTSSEYADSDGWCSLGDVVRLDSNGHLYFLRRLDRMINTGYHVYPDEIESAISDVRGVSRVRVVGEPHPTWGEMVVAYVVPSGEFPETELIGRLRQALVLQLAKYKIPREFRVVRELPELAPDPRPA